HTLALETYTLSLHDALPISQLGSVSPSTGAQNIMKDISFYPNHTAVLGMDLQAGIVSVYTKNDKAFLSHVEEVLRSARGSGMHRSEEHTSELQSLTNLVCRL